MCKDPLRVSVMRSNLTKASSVVRSLKLRYASDSTSYSICARYKCFTLHYITSTSVSRAYLDGWPPGMTGRCELGSVRRCGLKSVTDRLFSRHRADGRKLKPKKLTRSRILGLGAFDWGLSYILTRIWRTRRCFDPMDFVLHSCFHRWYRVQCIRKKKYAVIWIQFDNWIADRRMRTDCT